MNKQFLRAAGVFASVILLCELLTAGNEAGKTTVVSNLEVREQAATSVATAPAAGEQVKWRVIGSGGTAATGAGFKLTGTVGQTASGQASSAVHRLTNGFWQVFSDSPSPCLCGDANGSGSINISDAVFIINYIFAGGAAPNPICLGDANGTGGVNISDAVHVINFIFAGGPAPHCP